MSRGVAPVIMTSCHHHRSYPTIVFVLELNEQRGGSCDDDFLSPSQELPNVVRFHGNGGQLGFYGTHQIVKLLSYFKCCEKWHTHKIHINEETYRSVFSFREYMYILNICLCEKHL